MKIAVITGASSGLGREFAVQAARQGEFDEIWVVARRADRLKELAETLSVPVRPLPLDLQKPESFETLDLLFQSERAEVGLLVCAAGFGKFGACLDPVSYTHLDVYKRQPQMCCGRPEESSTEPWVNSWPAQCVRQSQYRLASPPSASGSHELI